MNEHHYDLALFAERMVCPATGLDAPGAVAIRQGRIIALGEDVGRNTGNSLECPDGILLPGLIDLHAHPATGGSVFGVDPDQWMLPAGTTTVLSQGDAGADNVARYIADTIQPAQTRVRLAINLSRIGESTEAGCFESLEHANVAACVAAIEAHRESIWGLAVNLSHQACGATDPREVLRRGLAAASQSGLPLLVGLRRPEDWSLREQLQLLRPGDVVTYCFRSAPHCFVDQGRLLPEIREAQEQGVVFDVGHGAASFNFAVAEAAIRDGFAPDTISTDLQARHVRQQTPHDLPRVMSKLAAAGMCEADIFAAVTARPARLLREADEIGCLTPGSCADLVMLHRGSTQETLTDCFGQQRSARRWQTVFTVRGGKLVDPDESTPA